MLLFLQKRKVGMGIRSIRFGISGRWSGDSVFMIKYVTFIIAVKSIAVSHKIDIILGDTENAGGINRFFKTNLRSMFPVTVCGIY